MAAASRRRGLLARSGRNPGSADTPGSQDTPESVDPNESHRPNTADPDLLEAVEADSDEGGDPEIAVAVVGPVGVDVIEHGRSGDGFRAEGNDDVWQLDDPISEEVRRDPIFTRLVFRTPPPTSEAVPKDTPRGGSPDHVRKRLGAVDEVANSPGDRPSPPKASRVPTPPPVSRVAEPPPTVSQPPQPQAAQDRKRGDGSSRDMFGTPLPTVRSFEPDLPTVRLGRSDLESGGRPAPAPAPTDGNVPATAGVLALGGAAMIGLGVAALMVVGILVLGTYELLRSPAPDDAVIDVPVAAPVPDVAPTEDLAPAGVDEVAAPAPDVEEVAPAPVAPRTPKKKAPEPEPEPPPPPPPPVAAPAPAPPPPAPEVVEEVDKKKKRKKK